MSRHLHAGFAQLAAWLLAPAFGPMGWLAHLTGAAAHHACLRAMAAARSPTASCRARRVGFLSFMLCIALYWLPACQAFCAVSTAMLRCPSLALLPAALLRPAVLWQLALVVLACERWMARACADMAALMSDSHVQ